MPGILFIDPGTRRLGWAKFADDGKRAWLIRSGVRKVLGKVVWTDRVNLLVAEVVRSLSGKKKGKERWEVDRWKVVSVWIEQPRHWIGDGASERAVAAGNTGAILKLMFLIGALRQALLERGYQVELVRVEKWKGNVPKRVTAGRVMRRWGYAATEKELKVGSDEADAVGIGNWYFRKGPGKGRKVVKRGEA